MNLLIVDDHAINLKLLRAQLEAEGHTVLQAANGAEALGVLEREPVDGVISDILMPVMDGFRLCLEIRRSERFSALPFVLYTSTYSSPEDRQLAHSVGADSYIVKPAPTHVVLEALRDAAKRAHGELVPVAADREETYVLKQYNEALVRKLEEKNLALQEALEKLRAAHDEILAMNQQLEARVEQRTAELQTANRELESFSSSVSHDLRAPLRGIVGFADMLRRDHAGELSAEAGQLLRRVEENARQMQQLIDDLLRFARLGRKALSVQAVNLGHLVRECLKELAPERQGRNVEIVMGEMPPCHGDPILLKQALLNLLGNAFKYTRKCEVARIEVGLEKRGDEHVGHVRDNGAGFDMRHAHKLFEVFQRLHSQSEFPGTGVGLAIVRRVFEKHGGRVWADAVPGQGATFHFSLPAKVSDA